MTGLYWSLKVSPREGWMNEFVKGHGLGNDYIVFDNSRLSFDLTPSAIRLLCHRNYGVGSDGILLLTSSETTDFGLRIFNPDGSEAEKSGNGVRIFAKYLYEHGHTKKDNFTIQTKGGIVRAALEIEEGRVWMITVDMGQATFRSREIPVAGIDREVIQEELDVQGKRLRFTGVSVGNPHCIILTDHLDPAEVKRLGPAIEGHPLFPQRINVQFAKVIARDRVKILIWERGAGYTLASGSSSCAVAAACRKNGLVDERVTIEMPGGELTIEVGKDWDLRMRGPAEEVCTGTISPELLQAIASGFEPPA